MGKGWTFQRLIDDKMTVTAHCHHSPCKNHSRFLDRVKLRDPEMRQALRLIGVAGHGTPVRSTAVVVGMATTASVAEPEDSTTGRR